MPERPEKTMAMLGKYLSLAMLVPSGALGGYWLGWFASLWVHAAWPEGLGVVLGVVSATYKVFDYLLRDARRDEREHGAKTGG